MPATLTEYERGIAQMLTMMMSSAENHGSECNMFLNEEFAAVWAKMQDAKAADKAADEAAKAAQKK
jgi:hypothetical protein